MLKPQPNLMRSRQVGQVHGQHQDVRDALVALALEVVLGQPEDVVAAAVHQLGDARWPCRRRSARRSSGSQRSLTGVASRPWSSRSTWPANRLPNRVIMGAIVLRA